MAQVRVTAPDGSVSVVEMNTDVRVHGADENGVYIGLVPEGSPAHVVSCAAPSPEHRWIDGEWKREVTLAETIAGMHFEIDFAAGGARMRYMTEVPGQQATYLVKQQQAEEFVKDGTVGAFLQAEADATGAAPEHAAQEILAYATVWAETVGPAIEKTRRAGKIAVAAALDVETAISLGRETIVALAAI